MADHFETFERIYEERLAPRHGALRRVVAEPVGRFLDCGLLEHGFARVRCARRPGGWPMRLPNENARDEGRARRLYEVSRKLVGLTSE